MGIILFSILNQTKNTLSPLSAVLSKLILFGIAPVVDTLTFSIFWVTG